MIGQGKRPLAVESTLSDTDRLMEYIMLSLRLQSGINFKDYHARFRGDFESTFGEAIMRTVKAGLITSNTSGVYPTQKGFDLQNMLIGEFIKKL